jgi:hypothetical protein
MTQDEKLDLVLERLVPLVARVERMEARQDAQLRRESRERQDAIERRRRSDNFIYPRRP